MYICSDALVQCLNLANAAIQTDLAFANAASHQMGGSQCECGHSIAGRAVIGAPLEQMKIVTPTIASKASSREDNELFNALLTEA